MKRAHLVSAVALAVLIGCATEADAQTANVRPQGPGVPCYPVDVFGVQVPGTCHEVKVTCGGIQPRHATILVRRPPAQTEGNVILFTGELSNARYSRNPVRRERIVKPLLRQGFSIFEVYYERWDYEDADIAANPNPDYPEVSGASPSDGIFHGTEGHGIDFTCAADAIMRHIVATHINEHSDYVCAAGNSNGGVQIAGALTMYRAEQYLRGAVISAGPPMGQYYEACFGTEGMNVPHSVKDHVTERLGAHEPAGAPNGFFSAMEVIDKLTGTYHRTNYFGPDKNVCARDLVPENDGRVERLLRGHSLVLSEGVAAINRIPRDYSYSTFVDFVSAAEDASGAGTSPYGNRQGNYYYEQVLRHSPGMVDRVIIGVPGDDRPSPIPQMDGDIHVVDAWMNPAGRTPGADVIREKLRLRCSR
jgi:hypothetical protein